MFGAVRNPRSERWPAATMAGMFKRGLRGRSAAIGAAMATIALVALGAAPSASADTTRTLTLSFSCDTGLPYGLTINTDRSWYTPSYSSYAVGSTKVYTISIPTSAISFAYQPIYCDNQPSYYNSGPITEGGSYSIAAGTGAVNALGRCADYVYSYYGSNFLIYDCTISSITYG
jgi:hypothetical protein